MVKCIALAKVTNRNVFPFLFKCNLPYLYDIVVLQVSGLNSGRGLKITIYAVNDNGRSTSRVIEGFTLKVAQLQVGMYLQYINLMCVAKPWQDAL